MNGWASVRGHAVQTERFRGAIQKNRLGGAFLFTGPRGVGKRLFAHRMAQALLCDQSHENEFDSCQQCPSCLQVEAGTHLDVMEVRRPDDKSFIPIELLIGERERRMQEGLCHFISMRPASGRRKIAIIDDADDLNEEGANALLKTLEEPPPRSILILIGTSQQKQLPTIRSRCQILRFQPLPTDDVSEILVECGAAADSAEAESAAQFADGSVQSALFWLKENNRRFREDWISLLRNSTLLPQKGTERIAELIAEAGKDNWQKREKLRLAVQVSLDFFRHQLRFGVGLTPSSAASQANPGAPPVDELPSQAILGCLERCEQALHEISANANVNLFIDGWISDLHRLLSR